MVGVPRSQGCRICVQRRVRCDGARPTCNNCRKGNRPCPGYGPGVKFQDEGPRLREKYSQDASSSSGRDESEEEQQPAQALAARPRFGSFQHAKQWDYVARDVSEGTTPWIFDVVVGRAKTHSDPHLDPTEALRIFGYTRDTGQAMPGINHPDNIPTVGAQIFSPDLMQFQLFSEFTSSMLPSQNFMPRAMKSQTRLYAYMQASTGISLLLDTAVRAVTLVHIGLSRHDQTFVMASRPYYGKALRLLTKAIADEEMGLCNETLCATIMLSFYEVFAADNDASWIRHAGGAGVLFQMRGPDRHRTGFDRDLFLSYRHTLIIEAMSNGVPSFLNEPGWRRLSSLIFTDFLSKNEIPQDRIAVFSIGEEQYNQMVTVSVALAEAHKLFYEGDTVDTVPHELLEPAFDGIRSCYDDHINLQRKLHKELQGGSYQTAILPSGDPVISTQYKFANVLLASNHNGYCTNLMLMNAFLKPMAASLGIDNAQRDTECRDSALDVCKSVNYMLISSFIGPFFAVFALRQALNVFEPGSIEGDWVLCKLFEIGDRRMLFAKDLTGNAKKTYSKPLEMLVEEARRRLDEYASRQQARAS